MPSEQPGAESPEEVAFLAAKQCIQACCDEAHRLHAADSPADRARAGQLLKSAAALRLLLRDRLLCIPACEAAGEPAVASLDQEDGGGAALGGDGGEAGGGGDAGAGAGGRGGADVADDGSGDTGGRDCRPSGAQRRARELRQAAQRRAHQRARAAERLVAALGAWAAAQEPWAQRLLLPPPPAHGPAAGAAAATAQPPPPGQRAPSQQPPAPRLDPPRLARVFLQARRAALDAELAAVSAAAELAQLPPARAARLVAAVRRLRGAEGGLGFHSRLARAAAAAVDKQGCADDGSFAYGSTPFESWLAIHLHPAVAAAVAEAMGDPLPQPLAPAQQQQQQQQQGVSERQTQHVATPREQEEQQGQQEQQAAGAPRERSYMVWGSSTGWLAFYGASAFGWRACRGVELLPCLVDEARAAAARLGFQGVSFECGDLLASSLEGVAVLQVTEQCWDPDLLRRAAAKAQSELAPGAVVVDYTGGLVSRLGRGRLLAVQEVAVSWGTVRMHACVMGPAE
ncbi:MAG: hypothetical protein J3K34DRAFT_509624 [Monoraphidium minutum]|nr:MAG: hypothetical protein J3K34DRAFT_509624 [Monoraphidium minutum]